LRGRCPQLTASELRSAPMPIATVTWVIDKDREAEFPDLLHKLRASLEARFKGHTVQIGDKNSPEPVPIIVHDVGDENVRIAACEELDRIDPDWRDWVRVDR
jgi:hypothetical protein